MLEGGNLTSIFRMLDFNSQLPTSGRWKLEVEISTSNLQLPDVGSSTTTLQLPTSGSWKLGVEVPHYSPPAFLCFWVTVFEGATAFPSSPTAPAEARRCGAALWSSKRSLARRSFLRSVSVQYFSVRPFVFAQPPLWRSPFGGLLRGTWGP